MVEDKGTSSVKEDGICDGETDQSDPPAIEVHGGAPIVAIRIEVDHSRRCNEEHGDDCVES